MNIRFSRLATICCLGFGNAAAAQDDGMLACLGDIDILAQENVSEPVASCVSAPLLICEASEARVACFDAYAASLFAHITTLRATLPDNVASETIDFRLYQTWLSDTDRSLANASECTDFGEGFEIGPCRAGELFIGVLAAYQAKAIALAVAKADEI